MVNRDSTSNRYYLHEVVDGDGNALFNAEIPAELEGTRSGLSADLRHTAATGTSEATVTQADTEVNSEAGYKVFLEDSYMESPENYADKLKMRKKAEGVIRELLNSFNVETGTKKSLRNTLLKVFDRIAYNEEVTDADVREVMDTILDDGTAKTEALSEFQQIRRELTGRRIYVNESVRADIGKDEYARLRSQARSNGITLSSDSRDMGIDSHVQELAMQFGEGMFPTDDALSERTRSGGRMRPRQKRESAGARFAREVAAIA